MTIKELKEKYSSADIYSFTANKQLRYEMYAPLLRDLFENKVIYRERFRGIIKIEDIKITPERFTAKAVPYLLIETGSRFDKYFFEQSWEFGAVWEAVRLHKGDNTLVAYSSWSIWCDSEIVKRAEELTLSKKFEEANSLMMQE